MIAGAQHSKPAQPNTPAAVGQTAGTRAPSPGVPAEIKFSGAQGEAGARRPDRARVFALKSDPLPYMQSQSALSDDGGHLLVGSGGRLKFVDTALTK